MKPQSKITVPEVIDQFREYYQVNKNWGPLSLVLLKANYKEAEFCYNEAIKLNDVSAISLAKILMDLTPTQRKKISELVK